MAGLREPLAGGGGRGMCAALVFTIHAYILVTPMYISRFKVYMARRSICIRSM
jgi:hypothetical protein